jgi:hypothetical protein
VNGQTTNTNEEEWLMFSRYLTITAFVVALGLLSGCQGSYHKETKLERNWGKSFEATKNQILNPGAGENLEPVEGLNGQSAERAGIKYRKGFEAQTGKSSYTINLGGVEKIGSK